MEARDLHALATSYRGLRGMMRSLNDNFGAWCDLLSTAMFIFCGFSEM